MRLKLDMESVGLLHFTHDDFREMIKNPDKLVIGEEKISIRFDYPVKRITFKHFTSKGGFTKIQLYKCIYEGYIQLEAEGLIINHFLYDLYIDAVIYDRRFRICNLEVTS